MIPSDERQVLVADLCRTAASLSFQIAATYQSIARRFEDGPRDKSEIDFHGEHSTRNIETAHNVLEEIDTSENPTVTEGVEIILDEAHEKWPIQDGTCPHCGRGGL